MPYQIEVWCRDCRGEDPDGCFDGGSEYISKADVAATNGIANPPIDDYTAPAVFDTEEAAQEFLEKWDDMGAPWEYKTVEVGEDAAPVS